MGNNAPIDDDEHWRELGKRVADPDAAVGIINFLDCYPSLRAHHSGLYVLAKDVVHRQRMEDLRKAIEARHSRGKAMLRQISNAGIFLYRVLRLAYRAGSALAKAISNSNGKRRYSSVTVYFPSGKASGHVQP